MHGDIWKHRALRHIFGEHRILEHDTAVSRMQGRARGRKVARKTYCMHLYVYTHVYSYTTHEQLIYLMCKNYFTSSDPHHDISKQPR